MDDPRLIVRDITPLVGPVIVTAPASGVFIERRSIQEPGVVWAISDRGSPRRVTRVNTSR